MRYTRMTAFTPHRRASLIEEVNFLLTNRIPRRALTRFMGWFSKIEQPIVRELSLAVWRLFTSLDLADARKARFSSVHDCFVRELRQGARPIDRDPAVLVSPCDAIVGMCGDVRDGTVVQAKGFPFTLHDLLHDPALEDLYRNGRYATLRLTSSMYHRFHAPYDSRVNHVTYISGDTWNVNPIALRKIERLFCKNERAVVPMTLDRTEHVVTIVPIAAILVASIRLHFLDELLHLDYHGANRIPCAARLCKGDEMGWFQHGSTIVVFAPPDFTLCDHVRAGHILRVGQPLMRLVPDCLSPKWSD
jgi:phosphatidylserine decarboxylase